VHLGRIVAGPEVRTRTCPQIDRTTRRPAGSAHAATCPRARPWRWPMDSPPRPSDRLDLGGAAG